MIGAIDRVPDWERRHLAIRNGVAGGIRCKPLSAWSRSWYSDQGRKHQSAELLRRSGVLLDLAERSAELPKLLTLTYADVEKGWIDTSAIRRFLNTLRTTMSRRGYHIDYLWTAEIQERCAIHYHVILVNCPFLDRAWLREIWPHGNIDVRRRDPGQAVKYATKYISKAVGDGGPTAIIRHCLHSGFRLRRFGCSRAISARIGLVPAWLTEWAAMKGADLELLDWEVIADNQRCYVFYDDEPLANFRYGVVKWRILTDLLNWQTPLPNTE